MKTEFEIIQPDAGSSFRILHHNVSADAFKWHYHYHSEYEVVCVFQGSGRRHVGNHLSNYEDGDLVLIGSNLPHGGFGYGSVGMHEEIVVQFKADFLDDNFLAKPELENIKKLFERSKQGLSFYGKTKEELSVKFKNLTLLSPFEKFIELLNILQQLATSSEFITLNQNGTRYNFSKKDQERLDKVYKYIEEKYSQNIDIQTVAKICNLTVPAFCNYFKKSLNQTFTDFTNEFRINQACKMLVEGGEIVDICYRCGFNNVSYFGRVFKQFKGTNPSQFRRNFGKT